ncbi:MAG: MBOAT family O-acyltransferase [Pirellulales bacterium]
MLFNSVTFLLFFSIVLVLHNLPFSWPVKKFNLLIASYLFYAAWNPPFVILIWISTLVDWFAASRMDRAKGLVQKRMFFLLSLLCNLGLLGFFKYGTFVLDNFVLLVRGLGLPYEPAAPNIVLPVGISFYTFQTLSYTIDVYRGHTKPCRSFLDFALFVTFFPQLVAGPIVRAVDFLPQCIKPHTASAAQFSWGLILLLVGLLQKVLVADTIMAPISDAVFNCTEPLEWHNAWAGTLAFSVQIFFDFAGYSTCAIGAALCLGFALPDNFRYPYAAIGLSDFWRRWHISLSSWLRDYLYIPLGGNRTGKVRVHVNLMVTMLLGGLWHGASWTFVAWGGLHSLYLIAERVLDRLGLLPGADSALWRRVLAASLTYGAVCFTWVLFRAQSFSQAYEMARSMVGLERAGADGVLGKQRVFTTLFVCTCVLGWHWLMRESSLEQLARKIPRYGQSIIIGVLLLVLLWTSRGDVGRAFIYFQF